MLAPIAFHKEEKCYMMTEGLRFHRVELSKVFFVMHEELFRGLWRI